MNSKKPLIIALDYANQNDALALVDQLSPEKYRLKVGKEMFTRFGPEWIKLLVKRGFEVFLDLKFHDIPQTVANACTAAADLGVWMINVHTLGGPKMLLAAKEALTKNNFDTLLIGVTLLTSIDETQTNAVGLTGTTTEIVTRLAKLAKNAGLDGVVCSGLELPTLRQVVQSPFCYVVPGIRLENDNKDDQVRVLTPKAAIDAGADYLVIGRPITQSKNPLKVLAEIEGNLK